MKKIGNNQNIFIDRIVDNCILSVNKIKKVYNFFLINNYTISKNSDKSDIIILDLCGFKNDYILKTRKKIDNYLKQGKKIILFGCISDSLYKNYGDKLVYIKGQDYFKIEQVFSYNFGFKYIDKFFKEKIKITDIDNSIDYYNIDKKEINSKGFISIGDGCFFNCSYCNIKKIKGETKSKSINKIIEEIKLGIEKGKKDFYLLSDDCGGYGLDIGLTFPKLLDEVFSISDEISIFITNLYPLFLIKYYNDIKHYIYSGRIKFIVLPLQHTSSRILKLMNREYDISKIIEILEDIKLNSNIKLINHIIFNYHTESFFDFLDTFKLLKYYHKNIYIKYSDINNLYGDKLISIDFYKKNLFLLKLQKKIKQKDFIEVVF